MGRLIFFWNCISVNTAKSAHFSLIIAFLLEMENIQEKKGQM